MDFIKYLADSHSINLNEQQQKAVLHIDGPVLLLAVPGGGKTTVIVSRCANMVINHGIDPSSILTLTFSKASALDMERRFQSVFGGEVKGRLHFSTIHSFCYGVLRTYLNKMNQKFPIIIEDENAPVTRNQLLKQLNLQYNNTYISDDKLEELSNAICFVKNMMLNDEKIRDFEDDSDIPGFSNIFRSYEEYKHENNYIDYDDMLTITLDLFTRNAALVNSYRNKYRYVNIDESQDTSMLQHRIIELLAKPACNIFMVGDEDQSIYTFRAAFPKALMDFEKTYPGARVYLMENNYRSTKSIVTAANMFIKQNSERHEKNMFCEKEDGAPVKHTLLRDKDEQYSYIAAALGQDRNFAGTAVLYRNNISAIPVADMLQRNNIPFYIREAKNHFFRHWVTTDILSFMQLSFDGSNMEAFRQIYYKMNAYISKAMLEYAAECVRPGGNVFEVLMKFPDINEKMALRLAEARYNTDRISTLNALDAITFIVDVIGYGEYIKKRSSEETGSADGLMQIVSSLKSIAARTGDIRSFMERLEQLQYIMESARFNKGKNAVTLSTIHSSKGLEFDMVYIIDLFDGQFPSQSSINDLNSNDRTLMDEEVRLFYVGATRARHHLELLSSDSVDGRKARPSRFIKQFLSVYEKQKESPKKNTLVKSFMKAITNKPELDTSRFTDRGGVKAESDLCVDAPVWHIKFGVGTVRFINPKFDLLEIHFESAGKKTLSLKMCIGTGLLHVLEEK